MDRESVELDPVGLERAFNAKPLVERVDERYSSPN
jgi:hypothetical protein